MNRFKHYKTRRPLARLAPLAQRLEPGKSKTVELRPLPVDVLKPLEKLVAVFPSDHLKKKPTNRSFGDVRDVSVEEFMDWGEEVRSEFCQIFWDVLTNFRLTYYLPSTGYIASFLRTGIGSQLLLQ